MLNGMLTIVKGQEQSPSINPKPIPTVIPIKIPVLNPDSTSSIAEEQ